MARKPATRRRSSHTPADLMAEVKAGRLAPLYFLHGPEDLTRDECLRQLTDAAVDPATRAFNLDTFRADDADISEIVNRAVAFPMMAPRRMVVVRQLERLPEPSVPVLLPVVQAPPETTVLVFTASRFDARRKLFAELRKSAECVEFKDPYDREVPDWIRRRARSCGKDMTPEAVHLLHITVGPNPRDLANELEKLAIHVADRTTIDREDVARIVGGGRGDTVFQLTDAVGQRKAEEAHAILNRLLEQGESPVGIVAMINRHVGILRKARWLQAARVSRQEMAGRLKVPPFFVSGYLEQARQFTDDALADAYGALLEADNRLKSGPRSEAVTMAVLVHRLCRKPGEGVAKG